MAIKAVAEFMGKAAREEGILLRWTRGNKDANALVEHEGFTRGSDVLWFGKDQRTQPCLVMVIRQAGGVSCLQP